MAPDEGYRKLEQLILVNHYGYPPTSHLLKSQIVTLVDKTLNLKEMCTQNYASLTEAMRDAHRKEAAHRRLRVP